MKLSVIDIGTQSLKHYIFDVGIDAAGNHYKKVLHYKRHSEANLGESLVLSGETIARVLGILQKCLDMNRAEGVEKLHIIGTEIFRKAENAVQLTDEVKRISGEAIEIISQDKEALYLYQGFIDVMPDAAQYAAINIGGGSTEAVVGDKNNLGQVIKLPFGAKYLRKTFGEHDSTDWPALEQFLDKEIKVEPSAASDMFITGVLTFITTVRPHIPFTARPCEIPGHPFIMDMADYHNYILSLRAATVAQLQEYFPLDPNFSYGTTMGHTVYYTVGRKLGIQRVIPSNNDLTDGIIYQMQHPEAAVVK